MPVVSPSRYPSTSSSLTSGSYRSTLNPSSSLDRPYYHSNSGTYVTSTIRTSFGDRTTEYRSRYSDVDGKRERKSSLVEYPRTSRAPSVTDSESGISSRYRTDRSESRGRDLSTTRSESSKNNDRNGKRSSINTAALAMSTAELYNKYSPANYVPLTQRLQQQQNQNYGEIARSKSISNDIGRPPAPDARTLRKARNSTAGSTISERPETRRSYKETSPSYKRSALTNGVKDTNGNEVPSVAEIRKRFDPKMTVTKLPANETKYSAKAEVEKYLSQLKNCENGTSGYTKIVPKDDKPVPVHLPSIEKNGIKWEIGSGSSRSNSNSDLSSKTLPDPVTLPKPYEKNEVTVTLTAKLPDRLASIKSQLDPSNPIGKILEKSTVIKVENGDGYKRKSMSPEIKKETIKNDLEKQGIKTPKHTSNFASYIQISQPIASGTSTPKDEEPESHRNRLKYIDSEEKSEEIDSPSGTGFENKTFEYENYLKKRNEIEKMPEEVKMETSVESAEAIEELRERSPEVTRKEAKEVEDVGPTATRSASSVVASAAPPRPARAPPGVRSTLSSGRQELAGGKAATRRSSERPDVASDDKDIRGLNGLRNIGNTCFMNSVLQGLSNTRQLLQYLSEDSVWQRDNERATSAMQGALFRAFASVMKELWAAGARDCVVNTTALKAQVQKFAPRFMGYSQQDAQEFLRYLLEGLHEDVNRVTAKPPPILTEIDDNLSDAAKAAEAWSRYTNREQSRVSDIFVGQLKSTLRCTHCQHDSVTFDPFWDLSLPIPSRTGPLRLQQCLQHFTKEEELDGDEKPTCSACGVRRKCLKWFTVQRFPQVLVLHLKRFSPTERFRGKLNVLVEAPLMNLDMSPFAAGGGSQGQRKMYNLYAVSNHSGTTYSGHYTAHCKHPHTGAWHEYNDSRVTPIAAKNVVTSEAYVLFYELNGS